MAAGFWVFWRRYSRLMLVLCSVVRPGKDYATFTEHGDEMSSAGEYHAACRQCFPDGIPSSTDGSSVTSEAEST